MKPSEMLRVAAKILEAEGWARGGNGACGTPKCAAGALNFAATGDTMNPLYDAAFIATPTRPAIPFIADALERDPANFYLVGWNDTLSGPDPQAEVIATFCEAADLAEAVGQ
jgi:hypothetical protein